MERNGEFMVLFIPAPECTIPPYRVLPCRPGVHHMTAEFTHSIDNMEQRLPYYMISLTAISSLLIDLTFAQENETCRVENHQDTRYSRLTWEEWNSNVRDNRYYKERNPRCTKFHEEDFMSDGLDPDVEG
ncbi:hypothetical protein IV203_009517 [Nitzschia inconspicua]|uniref:Uncharacterized protein n=1 Tax=Nitzschia inconspicua TaxID=303405 RepID=A0A9K3KVV5_9STRA|nr:hypothetical protein IV203_009505 [Nitzschia inconspicua]KAG7350157.1 hypothetical protein IV203_009517 [Nitzschia inconspicua]